MIHGMDQRMNLMLSMEKLKYRPKYVKDLPISIGGTTAWLIKSLGTYWIEEVRPVDTGGAGGAMPPQ